MTENSSSCATEIKNVGASLPHGLEIVSTLAVGQNRVSFEGKYTDSKGDACIAALTLRHKDFDEDYARNIVFSHSQIKVDEQNDIYHQYTVTYPTDIKLVATFPATELHIAKLKSQPLHLLYETKDKYLSKVLPYIKGFNIERIRWVYNILDGLSEADRVIIRDDDPVDGFVMVPDFKWNQTQMSLLYCQAIVLRRDICSIRDLTTEHLALLQNILEKGCEAIMQKYGVSKSQIVPFLHYHPSYYHLHVHFMNTSNESGFSSMLAGRAHLLTDIIENIKSYPNYYQEKSISVVVAELSELYQLLK